jgi:hypothetical protein
VYPPDQLATIRFVKATLQWNPRSQMDVTLEAEMKLQSQVKLQVLVIL